MLKVKVNTKEILESVKKIIPICTSGKIITATNNIKCTCKGGKFVLSATNGKDNLSCFVPYTGDEMIFLVNGDFFKTVLSSYKKKETVIELEENKKLTIYGEGLKRRYSSMTQDPTYFPKPLKKNVQTKICSVKEKDLERALQRTMVAGGEHGCGGFEMERGVGFWFLKNKIVLTGWHSHLLIKDEVELIGEIANENKPIFLSSKSVSSLINLLRNDKIEIIIAENKIIFKTENLNFSSLLSNAEVQDYKKFEEYVGANEKVVASGEEFLKNFQASNIIYDNKSMAIVEFGCRENKFYIKAKEKRNEVEIEFESETQHKDCKTFILAKLLIEFVKRAQAKIEVFVSDNREPMIIVSESSFLILMPRLDF